MKLLTDLLPVLLFFIAFKFYGIYAAAGIAIAAAILQVFVHWLQYRKVETMHLITLGLIGVLGGATLVFHNELFIKWKPTAINWAFALAFWLSEYVSNKSLTQRMLENSITLPKAAWRCLNLSWVIFFALLGFANLYVIYHFTTDFWVNFKLFGMMGLTIVFVIAQAIYMAKFIRKENEENK